jgi:hypothetical protein
VFGKIGSTASLSDFIHKSPESKYLQSVKSLAKQRLNTAWCVVFWFYGEAWDNGVVHLLPRYVFISQYICPKKFVATQSTSWSVGTANVRSVKCAQTVSKSFKVCFLVSDIRIHFLLWDALACLVPQSCSSDLAFYFRTDLTGEGYCHTILGEVHIRGLGNAFCTFIIRI